MSTIGSFFKKKLGNGIRYVDLFSGSGGLSLGLTKAGLNHSLYQTGYYLMNWPWTVLIAETLMLVNILIKGAL